MSVQGLVGMVGRIATRYHPVVYATADREDLAQEGAVGLLEAAARYDADRGASLATYGARRASGAMMDHVRTLARWSRETPASAPREGCGPAVEGRAAEERTMVSRVQVLRFGRFLRDQWTRLPGPEQDVLRLRYFGDATVREAGEAMGVSAATVCRLEQRALDRLRAMFVASSGAL